MTGRIVTVNVVDLARVSDGAFSTEASDLGIAPGASWPTEIRISIPGTLGVTTRRGKMLMHHGEFAGYCYASSGNYCLLDVFND